MSAKGKWSSQHVSDLLAEVFKRGGMKRAVKRAEAVLLWPQVVGVDVAKFTEAKNLQDGILYVEVSDSETSMHLMLQRQRFIDVYRGKFNVKSLREIRFRVGRPKQSPTPKQNIKSPHVDPQVLANFAKALSELPENLSQPTIQAAKAMLAYRERKKAEGWEACQICEALSPTPEMCDTCKRYATSYKIQRSSKELITVPDKNIPILSEDERKVAIHLAKQYLAEKLQELLPYVLADPGYKPELESVARCYLAHEFNKSPASVTEEDFDYLDSRITRALGRWK